MVTPTLHYRVIGTIDLCPCNCASYHVGAINEDLATIPMSRLEASGVAGDVPFTVDFTVAQASFTVPPPGPAGPAARGRLRSALFDYGCSDLRSGGEDALAAELGDRPTHADLTQPFIIEGHTDSNGSDAFNQGLSDAAPPPSSPCSSAATRTSPATCTPPASASRRPIAPNDLGGSRQPRRPRPEPPRRAALLGPPPP